MYTKRAERVYLWEKEDWSGRSLGTEDKAELECT